MPEPTRTPIAELEAEVAELQLCIYVYRAVIRKLRVQKSDTPEADLTLPHTCDDTCPANEYHYITGAPIGMGDTSDV